MAILSPMVAGDVPYPQYSVTTTEQINEGVSITKGVVYTKDATGRLVAVTTTLANGFFQAKASTDAAVEADKDSVQVLGPRSRMIFNDTVGSLVVGQDVILSAGTSNVVTGAKTSALYVGKVFEIYTRNSDGTRKLITSANDKVVVETVQA